MKGNRSGRKHHQVFKGSSLYLFPRLKVGASLLLITLGLGACTVSRQVSVPKSFPDFYKEGHRGARGLMPENTIPSMIKAVEVGANVIEVDIYTTKDGQVLVAHDPYVNVNHSLLPNGAAISSTEAPRYVWHQMPYEEIRKIDVGSKPYSLFPQQERVAAYMPLLGELIDSVEAYTASRKKPPVIYNIELKTSRRFDSLGYNAVPADMVKKVMDVVRSKNIGNRFYIQSFDIRPLQEVYRNYPGVAIGFLTDKKENTFEQNIKELGFKPSIYSPYYKLVTPELVRQCHQQKIKIVPWTVNTAEEMKQLIAMGVDGIITDYPNYLEAVAPAQNNSF